MKSHQLFSLICAASISLYLGNASAQQDGTGTTTAGKPDAAATPPSASEPAAVAPAAAPAAPQVAITEVKSGTGAEAVEGSNIAVHYTGWLYDANAKNFHGKKFDSSLDRGKPITFVLGAHRVIAGWEQGLIGMKVGGKRTLIIPSELGYGARGAGGIIPPNAMLVFDVELVAVK